MWYRYSSLQTVDKIADEVSKLNPYSATAHFDIIESYQPSRPPIPEDADTETRMEMLKERAEVFQLYNSIHPQIYIYPRKSTQTWWYLLFDPKELKRIENEDFHRKLDTKISIKESPDDVINILHRQYPTAIIDGFESEEEMLAQE